MKTCSICTLKHFGKTFCQKHYRAMVTKNDPAKLRKARASVVAWNKRNQGKMRASHAAWKKRHPEKVRAQDAAWRKRNPEATRAFHSAYKARKKGASGVHTVQEVRRLFTMQRGRCVVCRERLGKYHKDHILPLKLGGGNDISNIQLLCPGCNSHKHAKHPVQFMQERGFLL